MEVVSYLHYTMCRAELQEKSVFVGFVIFCGAVDLDFFRFDIAVRVAVDGDIAVGRDIAVDVAVDFHVSRGVDIAADIAADVDVSRGIHIAADVSADVYVCGRIDVAVDIAARSSA